MNGLILREITVDWNCIDKDSYLFKIPAISTLNRMKFTSPVTFFSGENGSGKSTLLEAIAIAAGFNPEGGSKNYNFFTRNSHSPLYRALKLTRGWRREQWGYFLRAESFYNVATQEEHYVDIRHPSKQYHKRSHGEGFLSLLDNELGTNGLYIFDEPEAALSVQSQLSLYIKLYDEARTGSQFIIATHSPILMGLPGAEILSFDSGEIHPTRYEDTDCYRITRHFLTDDGWRNQLLGRL